MQHFASKHGSRTARLWRVVAVFFLVFTAYDLLSPDACAEELLGLPPAAIAAACSEDGPAPLEPEHLEEDCFCCCSHLIVRQVFVVDDLQSPRPALAAPSLRIPSSPPQHHYRPPRV